ncbi:MAG: serine hydrolase [Alphaproteobacteria bacterium]|jgi:D-alanyl-D-alanine carboxypeptidase
MIRRLVLMILATLLATALVAPVEALASRPRAKYVPKTGTNDPRYAAYVLDTKTGEVLHAQNADVRRSPASLTKMMTLYLLFEALENGKVKMDTRMPVSAKAAIQPQTNISLSPGDTVPVNTAIRALIIRSANDVAVVVAEYLGKSEAGFAEMMNAKARALGMRNTNFENPNGLPNSAQVTTARDMAKLGIALKRDFPNYYGYFKDEQFSWKGVTYYTHNRVLGRFTGADGIKTGYTIASGFNLVTSANRGGQSIIGVVLGGGTAKWRDDRMITLLTQTYRVMASRGGGPKPIVNASNLPVDLKAPVALAAADQPPGSTPLPWQSPRSSPTATRIIVKPSDTVAPPPQAPRIVVQVASLDTKTSSPPFKKQSIAEVASNEWGIQVGAFSDRKQAERAAAKAYQLAQKNLKGSRIAVVGSSSVASAKIHRARLENISENQAKGACQLLIAKNAPCFIYRTGNS